jgi:hypothetical protein
MNVTSVLRPISDDDLDCLVFGMEWSPIIGARPERESAERAKAAKATHMVFAGANATVVGLARLPSEKHKKGLDARKLYSAGVLFAESHPQGVHAATVTVEDGTYWVIASHDGTVVAGTDLLCEERDEAEAIIADLHERYTGLRIADPSRLALDPSKKPPSARLQPIKSSLESIPRWVKITAVVFGLFVLVDQGTARWKKYKLEKDEAENTEQYVDATVEWSKALDSWQKGIRPDGEAGLVFLFNAVGDTPMSIGGWRLFEIDCLPSEKGWQCKAIYKRSILGTNISLLMGKPPKAQVGWITPDMAETNWTETYSRPQLDRLKIESVEDISIRYVSNLQKVFPAFKQVKISPRTSAAVPAPVVQNARGENRAIPNPPGNSKVAHIPGVQAVTFEGPLRSLAVLPLTPNTVLKSIHVKVADQTDPTLTNSMLQVDLKGDMYVQ